MRTPSTRSSPLLRLFESAPRTSLAGVVQKVLAVDRLNAFYEAARLTGDDRPFFNRLLDTMGVEPHVSEQDLERIPKTGRVLLVANHPFGLIEGIVLASVLRQVRPDARILTNFVLARFPEAHDVCIFVDPFGGAEATRANRHGMKDAMEWLMRREGLLAAFPAGEVSHFDPRRRAVTDPPWSSNVARLARRSGAPVVPVYFDGSNGAFFQLLGMVHPRLRTALLPHEFVNKQNRPVRLRIGSPVSARRVAEFTSDEEATAYLRHRTYLLAHRRDVREEPKPKFFLTAAKLFRPKSSVEPIGPAAPASLLEREIAELPSESLLLEAGETEVRIARSAQIPYLMNEIGRLREIAFRAAGEGSGKALDLDEFDRTYLQLFLWNRARREILGGYRLAPVDVTPALYTATLFRFGPAFLERLGPAVEMGRSFVRLEEQRNFAPLLLLWKGIGAWICRNPRYRTLFGPVSISDEYTPASRRLMVEFLRSANPDDVLSRMVQARSPFKFRGDWEGFSGALDLAELSALVAELEKDGKGVPILLKQYLKLGGKLIGFNVDAKFSNALDGLIVVDLAAADPSLLERYMGRDGARKFLEHHRRKAVA
jgi:putative hemolysin